ncbi:GNAT family N-acetyltransferase [Candidatus Parcubacteria bacterium]|nr:MAG: GNAT family N-acetyltransferase [Candidatus Parcubacteria bacterium]
MKITKAKKSDRKFIAKLLFELLNIKNAGEGEKIFLSETKKGHNYLIAKEKNNGVGLITYLMHGRPKHGLAELYHVVVMPEYRGTGAAKKLFLALEKELKAEYKKAGGKLRKLFLMTRRNNSRAQRFYKKMGMKFETRLKSHFYKGKDEYIFSKFYK